MGILQQKAKMVAKLAESEIIHRSRHVWEKMDLRELDLKLSVRQAKGTHLEVVFAEGLDELYGRKNLCLKIFKNSKNIWGYKSAQGHSIILESTVVQNLMALRGLAPRVYEIVRINGETAQVTDFIKGERTAELIADPRFKFQNSEVVKPYNQIGGKLVDFQGAIFNDFPAYKKSVVEKAKTKTSFPRTEKQLYQSTDYHIAKRPTEERLKRYNFPRFEGKTVLDIGCNLGMMMRAAYDKGAKRVVGIDWPDEVEVSEEMAILDGYFNLDFIGADIKKFDPIDLKRLTGIGYFDVHFFLAMENWVGFPDWVKNCGTMYYEGHGKTRDFEVRDYGEKESEN